MTRHISAEKLARFRDGDLSRAGARRVAAHLAGCAVCQADADALAGLPALLAGTQLPPMPDHLAARIETALVTESAHRAAGSPAVHPARRAGRRSGVPRWVVTDDQAKRHTRPSGPARRILATAAAIAVIGGGGYALVSSLGGSTSTTASGTSSAGQSRPEAGSAAAWQPAGQGARPGRRRPPGSAGSRPGAPSPGAPRPG